MDEINRKIVGNRIKELRKKKYLTQYQLAELVDVSSVYVSYVENGKRQLSLDNLIKIANVLEVTCDDILVLNQNARAYHSDIEDLLKDCNANEKKILVNFVQTVKDNLSFQSNSI
ncbi:helix-turn-helix domain-containing protein [Hungatella hathewayi]|uniref:helix-turn-helix domain-containing protein n=1 Tax=Hungatella hathewayi TaxID=154046 RepID=UPI00356A760C